MIDFIRRLWLGGAGNDEQMKWLDALRVENFIAL